MDCKVYPPRGFQSADCFLHIKQIVRTRSKSVAIRMRRDGYIKISGPAHEMVSLKIALSRYAYRLGL